MEIKQDYGMNDNISDIQIQKLTNKLEVEEAIKKFDNYLIHHQTDLQALLHRSLLLQKAGRLPDAINDLLTVTELDPDNEAAIANMNFLKKILDFRYMEKFNV